MLSTLTIQNVVLIEKLTLEFAGGLCALTGETGAGKSILLDSLGLALGSRSESRLVRKGEDKATVTASFELNSNHPAFTMLSEQDIESEDGTIIVRRTVSSDGRSKAFINDQPVSINLLKSIGETLVEIHGQNDTRGLLDPSTHIDMLDQFAGLKGALQDVWQEWQSLKREQEDLQNQTSRSKEEETYLRQSIEDLDRLAPEIGEEEQLDTLRDNLIHRERILEALNTAYHALNSDHDPVRAAWGALDRVADRLGQDGEEAINALDRATTEVQEAISLIQSISSDLEQSEHSLETIDDRLYELRAQARKHGCSVDELPAKRDELAEQLNKIEHADDMLAEIIKKTDRARAAYLKAAEELSAKRKDAASILDQKVSQELPPLKLDRAKFITKIETLPESGWGVRGMDQVRFLVATNPGADPGPLGKIASGGEMSRFMLALKVVMASGQSGQSLIFDEVDAGIGGSTADAVGERLARLADNNQIMVVTHAPQVAARASHHWIVQKGGQENVTTNVIPLPERSSRREEIARMLAGATITDEARAAADKLLEVG